MRRHAKTLLAGTLGGIAMLALNCGAATSQTVVLNNQFQSGDVLSDGTLNVVDQSDDTIAVTTATGNSFTGSAVAGDVDVQSTQGMSSRAFANTHITVGVSSGVNTIQTTAATGNTVDVGAAAGALLSGSFTQSTTGAQTGQDFYAHSQVTGNNAQTENMDAANQAILNSVGFGVTDARINASVIQSNTADALADGGVIFQYIAGNGILSSATVGNNVTSTTEGTTTQALSVTQSNNSQILQASHWGAYGTSQDTVTSATATANNVNLTNTGGSLDSTVNQSNSSYVRAQAEETSFAYGGASAVAYGVGNSHLAGNQGPTTYVDNTQVNSGNGIQSIANFSGDTGYDAQVSSTAIGNAVTGFACAPCQATLNARNSQTNSAGVGATSSVTVTGAARSSRATTTAVGNTATFYVTTP
jgi:hypothetical protein